MKRKVAMIVVLSLCFTVFSACGIKDNPEKTGESQESQNSEIQSSEIATGEAETNETENSEVESETTEETIKSETESEVTQFPSETSSESQIPNETSTSSETQIPSEIPTPSESQVPSVTPELTPEEPSEPETNNNLQEANNYYETGRASLYGLNETPVSYQKAYEAFMKAKNLGKVEANFYLGALYDYYSYPAKDYVKAKDYYEAAGDNPYAKLSIGFLYYTGNGVGIDKEKARTIWQDLVNSGYAVGKFGLAGEAYANEEYVTARELYTEMVKEITEPLFIAKAYRDLGIYMQKGFGVAIDYEKAMEYYQKAIEYHEPAAYNQIGWLYQHGLGVDIDYEKAMEYYLKAANLGEAAAITNIGWSYQNGLGVDIDYEKAMEYYLKAANLGNGAAMNNIGLMYLHIPYDGVSEETEAGGPIDCKTALEWLEKAEVAGYDVEEDVLKYLRAVVAIAETMKDPIYVSLKIYFPYGVGDSWFRISPNGEWFHLGAVEPEPEWAWQKYLAVDKTKNTFIEFKTINDGKEYIFSPREVKMGCFFEDERYFDTERYDFTCLNFTLTPVAMELMRWSYVNH